MLGFANQDSVGPHQFMSDIDMILPMKGTKNERAFAAIVYAMIKNNKILIAKNQNAAVQSDP